MKAICYTFWSQVTILGGELDVKVPIFFMLYMRNVFLKLFYFCYFQGKEGLVPANFLQNQIAVNPIHDACKRGNFEHLVECLMNKVPINVQDKAGNSALHWACRGGV